MKYSEEKRVLRSRVGIPLYVCLCLIITKGDSLQLLFWTFCKNSLTEYCYNCGDYSGKIGYTKFVFSPVDRLSVIYSELMPHRVTQVSRGEHVEGGFFTERVQERKGKRETYRERARRASKLWTRFYFLIRLYLYFLHEVRVIFI